MRGRSRYETERLQNPVILPILALCGRSSYETDLIFHNNNANQSKLYLFI